MRRSSDSTSRRNPFARTRRTAQSRLGPAMCFEWIYMTSRRVAMSLFARVRAYVRARRDQHVGRDSLQRQMLDHLTVCPFRDTKLAMIIPYLAGGGQGRIVFVGFFGALLLSMTQPAPPNHPTKRENIFPFFVSLFFFFLSLSLCSFLRFLLSSSFCVCMCVCVFVLTVSL